MHLTTHALLTPGLGHGQSLPPAPPSPRWDDLTPWQRGQLLDATPLVLSVTPGRTVLLTFAPPDATADEARTLDLRNLARLLEPGAWAQALAIADRAVSRQLDRLERDHGAQLPVAERQALYRELLEPAALTALLLHDPARAPTPSAWLLSKRGPLTNPARRGVRAAARKQRQAERTATLPASRPSRAKPVDLDPLVLACRAGMLAHLKAAPLALAFLHQGAAPKTLANSPATYRATRRRLEGFRQQARAWARANGYNDSDAGRAFPARCPRYVEPSRAATVHTLQALELERRAVAYAERANAA